MTLSRPVDEADLLVRLRAGEPAAFEALVREYHGAIKRTASALLGEAQAEEAVQETWLAAIRSLAAFEGRSTLKTWLFSILLNEARGRLRRDRREIHLDDLGDAKGLLDPDCFVPDGHWAEEPQRWDDQSPEALLSQEDFVRCLEQLLAALPEVQRSVLTLREYEGLALDQICNILSLSASNIRVLLHRARTRVYAMVDRFEESGTC